MLQIIKESYLTLFRIGGRGGGGQKGPTTSFSPVTYKRRIWPPNLSDF